jgi:hypothetical protein
MNKKEKIFHILNFFFGIFYFKEKLEVSPTHIINRGVFLIDDFNRHHVSGKCPGKGFQSRIILPREKET